ncbi:hypothetical protein ABZ745_31530 [Streptomyces sp. NPDC013082]|uniref:hypothetical protein n=2 Tax=Streptomyces TaxID=1883 RepID=UPI0030E2CED3
MSGMVNEGNDRFTLPRGATGFYRSEDGPLPETGLSAFRAALFAAARVAGGEVGEVKERAYPQTFHTATVVGREGENIALCHAHFPWVAFAKARQDWYTGGFLAPPPWAHAFANAGFTVLSSERLDTPLSDMDTSALTQSEWREIRFHGITTLGGILFNAWD